VGVGGFHLLRHNYRGAVLKLQTGADYLEPYTPACMGIQVARLIADARRLRAEIVALRPERFEQVDRALVPQVHLSGEL